MFGVSHDIYSESPPSGSVRKAKQKTPPRVHQGAFSHRSNPCSSHRQVQGKQCRPQLRRRLHMRRCRRSRRQHIQTDCNPAGPVNGPDTYQHHYEVRAQLELAGSSHPPDLLPKSQSHHGQNGEETAQIGPAQTQHPDCHNAADCAAFTSRLLRSTGADCFGRPILDSLLLSSASLRGCSRRNE